MIMYKEDNRTGLKTCASGKVQCKGGGREELDALRIREGAHGQKRTETTGLKKDR